MKNKEKQEMENFRANGGKIYPHYSRHKANSRQVELDKFNKSFKERKGKYMSIQEANIYKSGFNSGYKEGNKRGKENEKRIKPIRESIKK